jgi:hypothetical protein
MSEPSSPAPSGNQFTLRGIFILITAVSAILGLLALAIREPLHWLGTLGIIAFCVVVIGLIELGRKLFPSQPRFSQYVPPPPPHPLQTMHSGSGESPFQSSLGSGESPFLSSPSEAKGDG